MYQIITRSCAAPKSGGGKYRRPVRILVVSQFKPAYRRNDPAVIAEWSNVDSRYSGPRSAHGQALQAARELCERLNAELSQVPTRVIFTAEGGFREEPIN